MKSSIIINNNTTILMIKYDDNVMIKTNLINIASFMLKQMNNVDEHSSLLLQRIPKTLLIVNLV